MKGYIKQISQYKYQFEISCGLDCNGKRKKIYKTIEAKSIEEAQEILKEYNNEFDANKNFEKVSILWLHSKKKIVSEKTYNDYLLMCNKLIKYYKNFYLVEIDTYKIDKIEKNMIENEKISKSRIPKYRNVLSQIFNYAKETNLILNNPIIEMKIANKSIREYKEKELQEKIYKDLVNKGYKVQKEKQINFGGRIDLIAENLEEIIIVECKTKNNLTNITSSLGQLIFYKHFFKNKNIKTFVSFVEKPCEKIINILNELNIGYYDIENKNLRLAK